MKIINIVMFYTTNRYIAYKSNHPQQANCIMPVCLYR